MKASCSIAIIAVCTSILFIFIINDVRVLVESSWSNSPFYADALQIRLPNPLSIRGSRGSTRHHPLQSWWPFKSLTPPPPSNKTPTQSSTSEAARLTQSLLKDISYTSNGKTATPEQQAQVLETVRKLETQFPPSPTLLSNPTPLQKQLLDGVWYLQYTAPSEPGKIADQFPDAWKPQIAKNKTIVDDEKVPSFLPFAGQGSVSAAAVTIDTSQRIVRQILDVNASRVINDIELDPPEIMRRRSTGSSSNWGHRRICVGGSFRPSPTVPNRVLVNFDTCELQWNPSTKETNIKLKAIEDNGNDDGFRFRWPPFPVTIRLGFIFSWLRWLSQSQANGWLETTYLDENIRIGVGNKGTLFILTRTLDAVQP